MSGARPAAGAVSGHSRTGSGKALRLGKAAAAAAAVAAVPPGGSILDGSDVESLLRANTKQSDELDLVGQICRVSGNGQALICTGKPVFFCFCVPWGFEYVRIRDGTHVRVLAVETSPFEQSMYRVQLVRSSNAASSSSSGGMQDGMIGTIRACWLTPDPHAGGMRKQASHEIAITVDATAEADLRDRIAGILSRPGVRGVDGRDEPRRHASSSAATATAVAATLPGRKREPELESKDHRVTIHHPGARPPSPPSPSSLDTDHSYKTPPLTPTRSPEPSPSPSSSISSSSSSSSSSSVSSFLSALASNASRSSSSSSSSTSTSSTTAATSSVPMVGTRIHLPASFSLAGVPSFPSHPPPPLPVAHPVTSHSHASSSSSSSSAASPRSSTADALAAAAFATPSGVAGAGTGSPPASSPSSVGVAGGGGDGGDGPSFAQLDLPEGDVSAEDIASIVQLIEGGARDATYPLIFAKLAGKRRVLDGDVLRPFLRELLSKATVQPTSATTDPGAPPGDLPREALDVLTKLCSQVVDIRTGTDFLEINFNFGPTKENTIKIPGTYNWVLEQKYKEDPYLVHELNKPRWLSSDARTLVLKSQVRFTMGPKGITGMREGDIMVKAMFKFNTNIRTETKVDQIEYDSMDRPYIEMYGHNKPVIVDDHYVPRKMDAWLVVTVTALKKDIWIGLPNLGRP